ncbi:MAG: VOC family protein [Candidatus Tumulicola sp.]
MTTANTIGVTGIDATYYLAKDLERATEFYTKLLGFAPTMAFPGMASEWTFPSGVTFGLYRPEEDWHSGSGVMFNVPDVSAAVAAGKAGGVKFDDDGKIEDTPVCFMAFAQDSEGNTFILHQPKG